MKWSRWHGHKNHWYARPTSTILLEVDGTNYKITDGGIIVAENDGGTQQYAMDLCEAWFCRHRLNELALTGEEICT